MGCLGGRQAMRRCAFTVNPISPQACKPILKALTWLTTALVVWNALHTILALGVWQALCFFHNGPVECKDLAVATFHQSRALGDLLRFEERVELWLIRR